MTDTPSERVEQARELTAAIREEWRRVAIQSGNDAQLVAKAIKQEKAAEASLIAAVRAEELARVREMVEGDAARMDWLCTTLGSAVGGGVEVNDERLMYQEPVAGEEVRLYWYPETPVGFNHVYASDLRAAIDAARSANREGET